MRCSLRLRHILLPLFALVMMTPMGQGPPEPVTTRAASSQHPTVDTVSAITTVPIVLLGSKKKAKPGRYSKCAGSRNMSVKATTSEVVRLTRCLGVARFGEKQWKSLRKIVSKESGFNPALPSDKAKRRWGSRWKHHACGLFQAHPCTKMLGQIEDQYRSVWDQVMWGLGYISGRYKTPDKAWKHWQRNKWY